MITSYANGRIKNVIQLMSKAKNRKEQNAFVVEGTKMFMEAPTDRILETYVSESMLKKILLERKALWEKLNSRDYEVVSDDVFSKMSDTQSPQGILCVLEQFSYSLPEIFEGNNGIWMVLEDMQDPGNLGTIIRTGEGAGVNGIIMSKNTVDIYNPKTIRATMGSVYRVPFMYVENLSLAVSYIKQRGIKTYAAHLEGRVFYQDTDFTRGTAFFIGNEGNGLSKEISELADYRIKIPMEGQVESLNAGVAAAIFMYEAKRQRELGNGILRLQNMKR